MQCFALEIKQEIVVLVLKRTVTRVKEIFGRRQNAMKLINEIINKLEGDLV